MSKAITIDELIVQLSDLKQKYSGDAPLYVDDADTGYHFKLFGFRESNNYKGRLLTVSQDYPDYYESNDDY